MSESRSASTGSCTDWSPVVSLEIGTQQRGVGRGDLDEDQIWIVRGLEEGSRVLGEIGLSPQPPPCLRGVLKPGRPPHEQLAGSRSGQDGPVEGDLLIEAEVPDLVRGSARGGPHSLRGEADRDSREVRASGIVGRSQIGDPADRRGRFGEPLPVHAVNV